MTSLRSALPRPARLIPLACAVLLSLAGAPRAHAQEDDPEVVAQAKEHYKAGLEAYKAGKYDVAIRSLKKAYLLKRLPPLLLNIGATYRKMGDLDLSLHFYQKYLDEAPADAKDRGEVEKIIAEIKKEKAGAAAEAPSTGGDEPPPPKVRRAGSGDGEWNHNVIDAAPPDSPIDVRVSTPVMKGVKVYVYYRGAGQAEFNPVLMKRRGKEKVGRIPAEAVTGRSLQYYIEAKDTAGTVVKSAGSQANPNIIMIEEGVRPQVLASMSRRGDDEEEQQGDEEDRPRRSRKPSRDLDAEEAPTTGSVSDDEPVRTARPKKQGGTSTLRIAGFALIGAGAGLGVLGGVMLGLAKRTADTLTADAASPIDANNNPIFFNNDPNAGSTQEADLEKRGKIYDIVGIAGTVVGGVSLAAGISCVVADVVMTAEKAHPKKKKKKRRRVVEEDEEEEQTRWWLTPTGGPTSVGLSAGLEF